MTGEVTLSGNVLAIGGLKEKIGAAKRVGISTVILPEENRRNAEELDSRITDGLEFVYCTNITQVVSTALLPAEKPGKTNRLIGQESTGTKAGAKIPGRIKPTARSK